MKSRGHLTLQIRAQDIRLIGAAGRPGRDHHGPHEHPEVQLALPLDHAELLAEAVDFLLGQHVLEDLPHLVTGHGLPLHAVFSWLVLLSSLRRGSRACGSPRVKPRRRP